MNFDINEVFAKMMAKAKAHSEEYWAEIKPATELFLERKKDRIQLLADMALKGEISEEKIKSRMEDEKLVLDSELHAIKVLTKAIAQKTANEVIDVLQGALISALKKI
jgi:hypothetical protein